MRKARKIVFFFFENQRVTVLKRNRTSLYFAKTHKKTRFWRIIRLYFAKSDIFCIFVANYKTSFMKATKIIGREKEQEYLQDLYGSGQAEFVAIYGRRRVGKTFLIRELFKNEFVFDLAGLANAHTKEQLLNFTLSLNRASGLQNEVAKSWLLAFE